MVGVQRAPYTLTPTARNRRAHTAPHRPPPPPHRPAHPPRRTASTLPTKGKSRVRIVPVGPQMHFH